jgi:anti-anti-sigma factor
LPVILERQQDHALIRLEGECHVTSAAELRTLLLAGMASGETLRLDLRDVASIDISTLQLLWAAGRQAERTGVRVELQIPETAAYTARQAGFEQFPGLTVLA